MLNFSFLAEKGNVKKVLSSGDLPFTNEYFSELKGFLKALLKEFDATGECFTHMQRIIPELGNTSIQFYKPEDQKYTFVTLSYYDLDQSLSSIMDKVFYGFNIGKKHSSVDTSDTFERRTAENIIVRLNKRFSINSFIALIDNVVITADINGKTDIAPNKILDLEQLNNSGKINIGGVDHLCFKILEDPFVAAFLIPESQITDRGMIEPFLYFVATLFILGREEERISELDKKLIEMYSQKECFGNLFTRTLKDSISVIDGYVQLLKDGKTDMSMAFQPLKDEVAKILENCDLIDGLSRMEKDSGTLVRSNYDLPTLFDYILLEQKGVIIEKGIRVKKDYTSKWSHFKYDIQLFKKAFELLLKDTLNLASENKEFIIRINEKHIEIESACGKKCRERILEMQQHPLESLNNPSSALRIFYTRKVFEMHDLNYQVFPETKGVIYRIG
ncbi:hypothetical protein KAU32_00955 [bacterium]|nr:hypothetical protein [bacterium]